MNKRIIWVLVILLIITPVFSFDFDNVKSYDENTKTIEIKNMFDLPLIGSPIANITLISDLDVKVIAGKDRKIAEFRIENYKDTYDNAFKEMELFYKDSMNPMNHEFTYKYRTLLEIKQEPIHEETCIEKGEWENKSTKIVCTTEIIDYTSKSIYDWKEVTEETLLSLPQGTHTIGIFKDISKGERGEWIPTLFGVRIEEWATWTEAMNVGLVSYWKLNDSSSPFIDSVASNDGLLDGGSTGVTTNKTGISGNSTYFIAPGAINISDNDELETDNFTWNVWVNYDSDIDAGANPTIVKKFNSRQLYISGGYPRFRMWESDNSEIEAKNAGHPPPLREWVMYTAVANGTHLSLWINSTLVHYAIYDGTTRNEATEIAIGEYDGEADQFGGNLDEFGIWNRSLTQDEIIQLYNDELGMTYTNEFNVVPTVPTLNAPINNTNISFIYNEVPLNWSNSTDSDLEPITYNVQLANDTAFTIIEEDWYAVTETTNTTGVTTSSLAVGSYYWRVNAYDGKENSTWSPIWNFTITDPAITVLLSDPQNNTNFSTNNINLTYQASGNEGVLDSCNLWLNNILNSSDDSITQTINQSFNLTYADGSYEWLVQCNDSLNNWGNSTKRNFTVDTTAPAVSIDMLTIERDTVDLNYTVTDTLVGVDSCWYTTNKGATNTILASCANSTLTLNFNSYYLTLYVNDTSNNINSTNKNFTYVGLQSLYQNKSIEGGVTNITLEMKLGSNVITSSKLVYNNTNYLSNPSVITGNNVTYYRKLNAQYPIYENNTNISFYWNITTTYNTEVEYITPSVDGENEVFKILLTNRSYNVAYNSTLNLTLMDETTNISLNTSKINTTITSLFTIYHGMKTYQRKYGFGWNNRSSVLLYLYPAWATYNFDAQLTYSADTYNERNKYYNNNTLDNSTDYDYMYLLSNGTGGGVVIHTTDENDIAITGVTVEAYLYDLVEDSHTLVQSQEVDFNGEANFTLDKSKEHKFLVVENGVTIYDSGNFKPVDSDYYFRVKVDEATPLDIAINLNSMIGDAYWINNTLTAGFYYSATTNLITQSCLEVRRNEMDNTSLHYSTCASTDSGNLTYIFPVGTTDMSISIKGIVTAKEDGLDYVLDIEEANLLEWLVNMGMEGVFWAILVIAMMGLLGVAMRSGTAIVLFVDLGLFISKAFNLLQVSWAAIVLVICLSIGALILMKE